MKSCSSNFLVLLFAALVLLVPSVARAQMSDLGVKAGLWQAHVDVTMRGSTDGNDAQYCFTAGMTMEDYMTASNSGTGVKCSITNKIHTGHGISYDTACASTRSASKGHIDFKLSDPEHFSGTSHTTVTSNSGGKVLMEMDKKFTAKFVSSNCGTVKPLVVSPAGT
jgi:hypothetical protein